MHKLFSSVSQPGVPGKNLIDDIVKRAVVSIAFIIPVFFLTFINIPLSSGKGSVLFIAIVVILMMWLVARLKDGALVIPKSLVLLSLSALPIVFLLSSLFSDSVRLSLIGNGYETGTFAAIMLLSVFAFLIATSFDTVKKIFSLYSALFYTGIIVFAYLVLSYIFNSASFFQSLPYSIIGSLNDTALYFGFLAILSLVTIELIVLSKRMRMLVYATLALSLIGMTLINFTIGWVIVGGFSLLTFVYALSFGGRNITPGERQIPIASLVIMLTSLLFVLASEPVGTVVSSTLNIQNTEIRPSWLGTMDVAKSTLFGEGVKETVFGAGPNRFASKWVQHRPEGINATIAWNTDFTTGVGTLPSFVVTTGLLGLFAMLIFLGIFVARGAQLVIQSSAHSDKITRYALVSSFFAGLYLWAVAIFYVANVVMLSLAFIFTGIFVAALMHAGIVKKYEINILQDPRISFISVLALILLLVISVVGTYTLLQRFGSMVYYQQAVRQVAVADVDGAQRTLERAAQLTTQDTYYRDLSGLHIAKLGEVLNSNASEETVRAQFQDISRRAIDSALQAVDIDDDNYLNWIVLAQAYQSLIPFGLQEGYDSASRAYDAAIALNPDSPTIRLDRARLELTQNDLTKAKEHIGRAIELKNNYTAAIFLLSQIQVQEGEVEQAIESTQIASLISPNDMGIYFQLGFLKYQNNDYAGAASAFERSIELNPFYANAMYFLGLSYDRLGADQEAIRQFERILELNPGNEEVLSIVENLRAGRSAFESDRVPPPVIEPPEEREELPIAEEGEVEQQP